MDKHLLSYATNILLKKLLVQILKKYLEHSVPVHLLFTKTCY